MKSALPRTAALLVAIAIPSALPIDASSPAEQQPEKTSTTTDAPARVAGDAKPIADGGVKPGPLANQRKQLLSQIKAAEKRGVGVKSYMNAFQSLEEDVEKGADKKVVNRRVFSILHSLHTQIRRSRHMKSSTRPGPRQWSSGPRYSRGRRGDAVQLAPAQQLDKKSGVAERIIRKKLRRHGMEESKVKRVDVYNDPDVKRTIQRIQKNK